MAVINSATIVTPSREHGEFAYGYVVIQLPREEETRRVAVSFRVSLLRPSCPPSEPTRLETDAGSDRSRRSQISVVCLQTDGGRGSEDVAREGAPRLWCNCNVGLGLGVVSDRIRYSHCSPSHKYNVDLTSHGLNASARDEMLCSFDGTRRHRMRLETGRGRLGGAR